MATVQRKWTLLQALRHSRDLRRWSIQNQVRSIAAVAESHESKGQSTVPDPPLSSTRHTRIRDAKPFSEFLTDNFNRQHDYLRISLTERCNLRCLYCMPEEGIELSPNKDILTTAEIVYLSALFVNQGVNKIRLTGGEPTVRKDIIPLMQQIGQLRIKGLKEIALTTNGISLHRKLDQMVEAGLTGVNISLDTLDPFQFQILTRRQGFEAVMKSINRVQDMNKVGANIKLKINCVAMRGLNDHQIIPFVEMTRDQDIEVRFIEYMPFGGNKWSQNKMLPYAEMLDLIRVQFSDIARLKDARNDTSKTWQVPGFRGRVGFITSMTHNFCGTCNRLRITSDGNLKVCLHGNTEVSLRDILRKEHAGEPMDDAAFEAIRQLEMDRSQRLAGTLQFDSSEGWISKERQLLNVIGAAVKRKKEKHAGMGELENMKNRPMILIDEPNPNPVTTSLLTPGTTQLFGRPAPRRPRAIPPHLLHASANLSSTSLRLYSSSTRNPASTPPATPSGISPSSVTSSSTLTHLTPSGTAHMVNVGAKPPTRRAAIAIAYISFSVPEPHNLILTNSLKKGDVLSVARISAIMAAKRTSDLIPLCHPIALTKVEVDLSLIAPGIASSSSMWTAEDNPHGLVLVMAHVECVGPTGVEMEALTAVMAGALTVYDMVKGVDRDAEIKRGKVVYKSGGKTGTRVDGKWREYIGREFFRERGLEAGEDG